MKPNSRNPILHSKLIALTLCVAGTLATQNAYGTAFTWDGAPDGGGSSANANWSTGSNWLGDVAPSGTGHTLTFAGSTNVNAVNDALGALATSGTAITFASGAGSFNLSGNTLTLGSGGGGGQTIVQQNSANNQTISANINLSGGNGDRSIVFGSGAGSLTLSGNINFNGDWLFPTTTAGTIILSGNNTGDGKTTNAITAGTNIMRAMMRNNVGGTQLVLGSDTALGNSGTGTASAGTASFRGIIANQQLNLSTTGGDRNLSGSSLAINANNITFNGANKLTIGNIITVNGNRDFVVSSTGAVTVSDGLFLSQDQTGRQLYVNLSGAGGMVVNGVVADTFHSSGLTTAGSSTLRKAGTGMLTLNGNSSYTGATFIDAGTLKIGHANALGATGTAISTTTLNAATLDLNGYTIGETVNVANTGTLSNTSGSAAQLTADTNVTSNFTVNATGDITATRLIGTGAIRTITKLGNGTLTTNGTSHNNLSSWDIQAGKVVLANTSGYGADRGVAINGGTLQLSGANSDLINNNESFTINSGTFDLNGKSEAVASIGGAGGTIRNSAASTTSTLYVGGGVSGSSTASYGGVIENGAGTLKLAKEGAGIQTLTGTNTYTGATSISAGTLVINGDQSAATGVVTVAAGGTNATAVRLSGTGIVGGNTSFAADPNATSTDVGGIHSVGNSSVNGGIGKQTFDQAGASTTDLTYNAGSIFEWQLGATVKDSDTLGAARGTDWDAVNVTGTLSGTDAIFRVVLNSSQTFAESFWNADHQWTDIFKTGDAGSAVSFASIFGGGFQFYNDTTGAITNTNGTGRTFTITGSTLTWSAVPEPSSALAGILLGVGLLRRRRN